LTVLVVSVHGVVLVTSVTHSTLCSPFGSVDHIYFVEVNVLGVFGLIGTGREDLFERCEESRVELFGEGDVELDDQVSHLVVSVRWHSLSRKVLEGSYYGRKGKRKSVNSRSFLPKQRSKLTRFDDVSGRHSNVKSPFVEVHDGEGTSGESGEEIDFDFTEEIVTLALEEFVRLLFDHNYDVSGFYSWCLIGFSRESNGLTFLHSSVDVNFEYLAFVDDLLSVAVLASILGVDDFTFTVTIVTGLLDLLNHRTELTKNDLDSLSFTRTTSLDGTFLSSLSFTFPAEDVLLKREFRSFPLVQIFERNLDAVYEIFTLPGSLRSSTSSPSRSSSSEESSSSTEQLREQILRIHSSHSSSSR
jgi:hypothetical protein